MSKSNRLTPDGKEILDSTPIAINLGRRKIHKYDEIRNFIRQELSNAAADSGAESWEEANDFDIPDDPLMQSPWEYTEDQEAEDLETIERAQNAMRRQRAAARARGNHPQDFTGATSTAPSGTPVVNNGNPAPQPGGNASPPTSQKQ